MIGAADKYAAILALQKGVTQLLFALTKN